MRSNRLWRVVLAVSLVAAAAATLVSVAGASQLQFAATAAAPSEPNIIDPLSRRGEAMPADRSDSERHGKSKTHNGVVTPTVSPTAVAPTSNATGSSFEGLSMWDQRTLNGFYLEPPDQGMCASSDATVGAGGRVLEGVNDVVAVYNSAGSTLKEETLNHFFGYPELLLGGPELTDPSCYYDSETHAWFVAVLTLDLDPNTGNFTGRNHIDINVSSPADHDPSTTTWKRYTIDATDNGTNGTPNHHCAPDPHPRQGETVPDACIGDYPHIGADHYGFYVTTNEYPFFTDGFNSAQIYALSKHKLAANASSVSWVQFGNTRLANEKRGPVGFTIWPAQVPGTAYNEDNNGTEFLLSSDAAEESGNQTGSSDTIGLWAITNSKSLDSDNPNLHLSSRALSSEPYGVPPHANQPGSGTQDPTQNWPLGQCLNIDPCFQAFLSAPGETADPYKPEVIGQLDSNDSRMQQVYYANGKVWGALDTRMNVSGNEQAGIAWFIVKPDMIAPGEGGKVGPQSAVVNQGYVGVAGANVTYPALAVTAAGRGAMAFTLVGPTTYPSAADVLFDNSGPTGSIFVTAQGLGLQDGFSEYRYYSPFAPGPNGEAPPPRPRWGDYGAADEDNGAIWIASEEIHNNCSLGLWASTTGHCGPALDRPGPFEARRLLGNWNTHIARIAP